jgi:hypothetical protein
VIETDARGPAVRNDWDVSEQECIAITNNWSEEVKENTVTEEEVRVCRLWLIWVL